MCGILGIAFQKGHNMRDSQEVQLILKRLLIASRARGGDATGVAFVNMEKATVIKQHIPATDFVDTKFYNKMVLKHLVMEGKPKDLPKEPLIILGHTRAKTKGTQLDRHNNHPIIANKVIGVHNGVISNDEDLFSRHESNVERKARVDSEVIFRLIDFYANGINRPMIRSIKRTTRQLIGGFACATVNISEPWMLYLFRGGGPIDIYRYPERGLIIFASSKFFIDDAVEDIDLGRQAIIPIEESDGLAINVQENKQTRFKITQGSYSQWRNQW